jgi:hypothetical protein
MYAEVETHVAVGLEAEGLFSSPQMFNLRNKRDEALAKLFITFKCKTRELKHYTKCLQYQSKYGASVHVEGWQGSPS